MLLDKIIRKSPAPLGKGQQESSSFLKKRTKKLLLCWLTRPARSVRIPKRKSFLVLFFKKELLPSRPLSFAGRTPHSDLANNIAWAPSAGFYPLYTALAASLLLTAFANPALADPPPPQNAQQTTAEKPDAAKPEPAKIQQVSKAQAEGLLGQPVDDGKGNVVGHVIDVLIDDTGKPKAAIIDFAGFFGFGNRQIAVDYQALGFRPVNNRIDISIHLDADKLKAMPEYQPEATSVPVVTQATTKPH